MCRREWTIQILKMLVTVQHNVEEFESKTSDYAFSKVLAVCEVTTKRNQNNNNNNNNNNAQRCHIDAIEFVKNLRPSPTSLELAARVAADESKGGSVNSASDNLMRNVALELIRVFINVREIISFRSLSNVRKYNKFNYFWILIEGLISCVNPDWMI